jgi:hypothetical protein
VQAAPPYALTLQGWGGIDSVTAPDLPNTWHITGASSGMLDNISFTSIENLTGGSDDDTFAFAAAKAISGQIDGGAGSNTLDFSAYRTPIIANLQTGAVTATKGFSNIDTFVGGASLDKLIGPNASNTWNITSPNAGTVGSVSFASFESLTGGTLDDTATSRLYSARAIRAVRPSASLRRSAVCRMQGQRRMSDPQVSDTIGL